MASSLSRGFWASLLTALAGLAPLPAAAAARAASPSVASYRAPEGPLATVGDAVLPPMAEVSPDGKTLLLLEAPALPPVSELAGPRLAIGELLVDPAVRGPAAARSWRGLALVDLPGGGLRRVAGLPSRPRLGDVTFSPDGRWLAFSQRTAKGMKLWLAPTEGGSARRLPGLLNAVLPRPCQWLPDSRGMICRMKLEPEPAAEEDAGPQILDSAALAGGSTEAGSSAARRFAGIAVSQLVRVSLQGRVRRLGSPDLFRRAEPSPDGRYLLVERLGASAALAPELDRFPVSLEIWEASGRPVRTLARLPQTRSLPAGEDAVRTGPRALGWRGGQGATLVWAEALDGGDPGRPAPARDRLLALVAPFRDEPETLADLPGRVAWLSWSGSHGLAAEAWHGDGGASRLWLLPEAAGRPARLLAKSSLDEAATDPAEPTPVPGGASAFYLTRGHAAGAAPRVERIDPESGVVTTVWRSEPPFFELPVGFADAAAGLLVLRRESAQDPPDFFLRDLRSGTLTRLTRLPPPGPALPPIRTETLGEIRSGGVPVPATLSLPASWEPRQGPLPALVWIDPGPAAGAPAAVSPYLYPRPALLSPRLWAAEGYAVLEVSPPVHARDGRPPGDGYVDHLVADVEAAVSAAVARGSVDRGRLAAGGHSFGAAAVATLLAETDLFRSGIALSGAYNRTLTPFGFQWERRTLWQAPQAYLRMSPLLSADRIREPLLLVHGLDDPHPATPPLQSQELWRALNGLGATARLVLLPHEGHTYQARESVLHVLAEIQEWLRWTLRPGL